MQQAMQQMSHRTELLHKGYEEQWLHRENQWKSTAEQWTREANDMKNVLDSRLAMASQENAMYHAQLNSRKL